MAIPEKMRRNHWIWWPNPTSLTYPTFHQKVWSLYIYTLIMCQKELPPMFRVCVSGTRQELIHSSQPKNGEEHWVGGVIESPGKWFNSNCSAVIYPEALHFSQEQPSLPWPVKKGVERTGRTWGSRIQKLVWLEIKSLLINLEIEPQSPWQSLINKIYPQAIPIYLLSAGGLKFGHWPPANGAPGITGQAWHIAT